MNTNNLVLKINNVPTHINVRYWDYLYKLNAFSVDEYKCKKIKEKGGYILNTPLKFNKDEFEYFIISFDSLLNPPTIDQIKKIAEEKLILKIEEETKPKYLCALSAGFEYKKMEIRRYFNLEQIRSKEEINFILDNLNVKCSGLYDIEKEKSKYL